VEGLDKFAAEKNSVFLIETRFLQKVKILKLPGRPNFFLIGNFSSRLAEKVLQRVGNNWE
jgi:hypothetical protein